MPEDAETPPTRPLLSRPVRVGAAVAVGLALAVGSLWPSPGTGFASGPLGLVGADAWLHAAGYAALAVAVAHARTGRASPRGLAPSTTIAWAVGIAVAVGLGIELLQVGVPGRQFDVVDLAANAVGAAAGAGLWAVGAAVRFRRRD